jgi:hypothetical protein
MDIKSFISLCSGAKAIKLYEKTTCHDLVKFIRIIIYKFLKNYNYFQVFYKISKHTLLYKVIKKAKPRDLV